MAEMREVAGIGHRVSPDPPPVRLKDIYRRFWPDVGPYQGWFAAVFVLASLRAAGAAAAIWLYKLLVDNVLVPRSFAAFIPIAAAYIALEVGGSALSALKAYLSTWMSQQVVVAMRTRVFRHLAGLSMGFFERRPLGDIISRLTGDIDAIEALLVSGVTDALSSLCRIVFFVVALCLVRWELAAASLVILPPLWLLSRRFSHRIREASREQRRRAGSTTAAAEESLSNIAIVQSNNRQEFETVRFRGQVQAKARAILKAQRLYSLFQPAVGLVDVAGILCILSMGIWEVSAGRLTVGGLLAFIAWLQSLYDPVRGLTGLANTFAAASASGERIIEVMDQRPSVVDRPGAVHLHRARGSVAFEQVSFTYPGSERPALQGVSFRIEPGETRALVGLSGAGKSTVTRLMLRFYDPAEGRLLLDGLDLRDIVLESIRENVTLLQQETLIFDGTVRDNIAYGREGATADEVARAAQAADAHGFVSALPQGYETRVGQKGRLLSGGQRQRIGIARAMIRDTPVLVLDEPTTGLDAETTHRILDPLRRLIRGRATLIVTHNLSVAALADRVTVLSHGRVIEEGSHEELLRQGDAYAEMFALQAARGAKLEDPSADRDEMALRSGFPPALEAAPDA